MAITFQSQDIKFKLAQPGKIKLWIKTVIEKEGLRCGQVNFVFTSDEELLKINLQYLQHNTYTDIITFDYCENDQVNGDIIISWDRVRDNAAKFKVDELMELHRVIIHGVLHLCGYKDKSEKDAKNMRAMENVSLKILG